MKMEKLPVHDYFDEHHTFLTDVCAGLSRSQRAIPPKYFYDTKGSELFEKICATPEYYPTRTETAILERYGAEMAQTLGNPCALIEFGSGSAVKTPLLLRHTDTPSVYIPIDISKSALESSALHITVLHPEFAVHAICADYLQLQSLPVGIDNDLPRVIFFPGSTIGNYTPEEARQLMRHAAKLAGDGSGMLIGVDCKKSPAVLNAAYNDAEGLTAAFNLNLLARMQGELGAVIEMEGFSHYAFYNPVPGRIEMHLVSRKNQQIKIGEKTFSIRAGESIHTENSYKYTPAEFQELARSSGWQPEKLWMDEAGQFSLHYLKLT